LTDVVWYDVSSDKWQIANGGDALRSANGHAMHSSSAANNNGLLYFILGQNMKSSTMAYIGNVNGFDGGFKYPISQNTGTSPSGRVYFSKGFNPCTGDFYVFGGLNGGAPVIGNLKYLF
jgi:hypothetical protein